MLLSLSSRLEVFIWVKYMPTIPKKNRCCWSPLVIGSISQLLHVIFFFAESNSKYTNDGSRVRSHQILDEIDYLICSNRFSMIFQTMDDLPGIPNDCVWKWGNYTKWPSNSGDNDDGPMDLGVLFVDKTKLDILGDICDISHDIPSGIP